MPTPKPARADDGPVHYHTGGFPPADLDWNRLVPLIGPASAALARYDALLAAIPNAAVLLAPLTTQEAVLSSRIEGTQATIGEVLQYEATGGEETLDPTKREDIEEVLNYRRAMRQAVEELDSLPLCNRLVKNIHRTLLAGVRGHDKARGEFRTVQNFIGVPGRPVEQSRFVPIAPENLEQGMARWERYLHEDAPDKLIQLAIVHAEFESLHPFLDGNGRIGRMLVPIFLYSHGLLHSPMFYLSEVLEEHQRAYRDALLAVSRDNDWTGWCHFFLQALTTQAVTNEKRAVQILSLYNRLKDWIMDQTHSQHAIRALDFFFKNPIFNSSDFIEHSEVPNATARRFLTLLSKENGILQATREGRGSRPTVYEFRDLIEIAER